MVKGRDPSLNLKKLENAAGICVRKDFLWVNKFFYSIKEMDKCKNMQKISRLKIYMFILFNFIFIFLE